MSILSAHDVRLEDISDLRTVYRHEIRPALTKAATAMNRILKANAASRRKPDPRNPGLPKTV